MIRFHRQRHHTEILRWSGHSVGLVEESLGGRMGASGFGVGAVYHRPVLVEVDGFGHPVRDPAMIARLMAVSVLVVLWARRWLR